MPIYSSVFSVVILQNYALILYKTPLDPFLITNTIIGHRLATKTFIGNLPAIYQRGVHVGDHRIVQ